MVARWLLTSVFVLAFAGQSFAQSWQFRWQKGETLTYKVKHLTYVSEVVDNKKTEANSILDLNKRWQVTEVDQEGVATLEMSLVAMRNEQKRSGGDTLLFDSQDLDKSTPELRVEMNKFIGKTLAVLRVDRLGKMVEAKQGFAARYEVEPAFAVVFADMKGTVGQSWRRPYVIVMEPPLGTGEKYQAEQVYVCKKIEEGKAFLDVATQFKTLPDNMLDRLPLLQKDVQGEVVFDLKRGKVTAIQLNIDKKLENHQGKGSSYLFRSRYSEVLVGE